MRYPATLLLTLLFISCGLCDQLAARRVSRDTKQPDQSQTLGQMFNFLANIFNSFAQTKTGDDKILNETKQNGSGQATQNNLMMLLDDTNTAINPTLNATLLEDSNNVSVSLLTAQTSSNQNPQVSQSRTDATSTVVTMAPESNYAINATAAQFRSSTIMTEPLAERPENKCFDDAFLENFCSVPDEMKDISFWDLYSVLYSDTVLDALLIDCDPGTWCLQDRFDYWEALIVERVQMVMESQIATTMCRKELQSCLQNVVSNFKNCSEHTRMVFTSDSIALICQLKENPTLPVECFKHTLTALHVTFADISRESSKTFLPKDTSEDICTAPGAHMTKGLICVANSCPGEADIFQSFQPWNWFNGAVDDLIVKCGFETSTCIAFLQKPKEMQQGRDFGMWIGVSVATMVTAVMIVIVVCTCYKRRRDNVIVKDGYQKLPSEGDEA